MVRQRQKKREGRELVPSQERAIEVVGARKAQKICSSLRKSVIVAAVILSLAAPTIWWLASPMQQDYYVDAYHDMMRIDTESSLSNANKKYLAVDCQFQITTRNNPESNDPNIGLEEIQKRQTITNPPFWISLHKESYDLLRWNSIMKKGNYYETGITDQFQQILANTQRPGLVLDIGMNIGWFTLLSRAHGHAVASFEPNPIMHTRVCEALELNQWHENSMVQLFPYGLGEEEAVLNLTTGKNPGGSSFHEERLAKSYRKKLSVRVVTLDSVALQEGWLNPDGPPIYLMKIDVEGYEPFVLGGGKQLLNSGRVNNIIMENSVGDLRTSADLLISIHRAGYNIHLISTVNGKPYHPEMLEHMPKAFESARVGMELENIAQEIKFFAKVTCNIWWVKR